MKRFLLLISILILFVKYSDAAINVNVDSVKLAFDETGRFEIFDKQNGSDLSAAIGQLVIYDGKTQQELVFDKIEVSSDTPAMAILKLINSQIDVFARFTPCGKVILVQWTIANKTSKELWLEPQLVMKITTGHKFEYFWTGLNEAVRLDKNPISRDGIRNPNREKHWTINFMPFPVAGLYGEHTSLFAGGLMFDPVSYYASRYIPDISGDGTLKYAIRIVINPEKTQSLRMVLGTAVSTYGGMDGMVQRFYDSFPEEWAPAVGQDNPYIWGTYDLHASNRLGAPNQEFAHRLYQTIEWFYAPFKRSGDAACREDKLWNYTPALPFSHSGWRPIAGQEVDWGNISRGEYVKLLRNNYLRYGQAFGWMFYMGAAGQLCEVNLARERYRDAIAYDPTSFGLGAMTGYDDDITMFPLGTSFGKVIRQDIKDLAKDLDLPGFAFDCAASGTSYRGPAVKKNLSGKAWDQDGVFIDSSVAINELTDYVRSIRDEEDLSRRLVVWTNGYLKSDMCMVEAGYPASPQLFDGKTELSWVPLARYLIGPRPGVMSNAHGYRLNYTIRNWKELSKDQITGIISKMGDDVIFQQLKFGITEQYLTIFGVPQVAYAMPETLELIRAGWQACLPIQITGGNDKLFKARYGKGPNTYMFFGNPDTENLSANIAVDNRILGARTYLFVRKMRSQAQTENLVEGSFSRLKTILPPRTPVLYETACGLNAPEKMNCSVTSEKDINYESYKVIFKQAPQFSTPLSIRKRRNFELDTVMLNGEPLQFKAMPEEYMVADCSIPGNGAELVIRYRSRVFHMPQAELLAFPFTNKQNQVAFEVEVPDVITIHPNASELQIAEHLKKYFDFCIDKGMIAGNSPSLKIKIGSKVESNIPKLKIFIGKDKHMPKDLPSGISRLDASTLCFRAADAAEAERYWKLLAYVLDEKFSYIFPFVAESFPRAGHKDAEIIKHFKLEGEHLPYRKYFE